MEDWEEGPKRLLCPLVTSHSSLGLRGRRRGPFVPREFIFFFSFFLFVCAVPQMSLLDLQWKALTPPPLPHPLRSPPSPPDLIPLAGLPLPFPFLKTNRQTNRQTNRNTHIDKKNVPLLPKGLGEMSFLTSLSFGRRGGKGWMDGAATKGSRWSQCC